MALLAAAWARCAAAVGTCTRVARRARGEGPAQRLHYAVQEPASCPAVGAAPGGLPRRHARKIRAALCAGGARTHLLRATPRHPQPAQWPGRAQWLSPCDPPLRREATAAARAAPELRRSTNPRSPARRSTRTRGCVLRTEFSVPEFSGSAAEWLKRPVARQGERRCGAGRARCWRAATPEPAKICPDCAALRPAAPPALFNCLDGCNLRMNGALGAGGRRAARRFDCRDQGQSLGLRRLNRLVVITERSSQGLAAVWGLPCMRYPHAQQCGAADRQCTAVARLHQCLPPQQEQGQEQGETRHGLTASSLASSSIAGEVTCSDAGACKCQAAVNSSCRGGAALEPRHHASPALA